MNTNLKTSTRRKYRRMRLPNGFGQISKIKGNLRNPYRVMVTVGKTDTGRPICKTLKPKAYFPTYNDAYKALIEYNENPYLIERRISLKELYDKWAGEYFKGLKSTKTYTSAWKYCSYVYDMEVQMLRASHIKYCMEYGENTLRGGKVARASLTAKANIKLLFNLMLDYAVERGLVSRNVAREMVMPKSISKERTAKYKGHKSFTDSEFKLMCEHANNPFIALAIIECFTGLRPSELTGLKSEDIDLKNGLILTGSKTEAGRNRIVPIHPSIKEMTRSLPVKFSYEKYRVGFTKALESLGIYEHRLHDCRKHFVTMAKRAGCDEYAIKRIVGHKIADLTESVYTDRDIDWLRSEISKIPAVEIL